MMKKQSHRLLLAYVMLLCSMTCLSVEQEQSPTESALFKAVSQVQQQTKPASALAPAAMAVPAQPQAPTASENQTQSHAAAAPAVQATPELPKSEIKKQRIEPTSHRMVTSVIPMGGNADVVLNFNNASLRNVVNQIADIFNLVFWPDDMLQGPGIDTRSLDDTKINFKTIKPMTKREAWHWFISRLKYANWALTPTADPRTFNITATAKALKQPVPTYINCTLDFLPDNDMIIRYVYELTNSTAEQMKTLLDKLKSANGVIDIYSELKTLIITDSSYNIKALMRIVQELDNATVTQVLSVLRLQDADASEVATLITALQSKENPSATKPTPNNKKAPTVYAIPEDVKVIPEPRTNSLIILGSKNGVAKIENFIKEHIDTKLKQIYQPVHVYELNYAPATEVATILKTALTYGADTAVGKAGGVRGGEKYFANVSITPETQGNRLIIRASKQDFEHLKKIIQQLDRRQEQVAVEVLIVSLKVSDVRQLGAQWTNKYLGNLNVQMSGIGGQGVQTDPTTGSIYTNLIALAKGLTAGTTVLTFGKTSVWAIFSALQSLAETRIVSNPFLIVTNKYKAAVAVGSTRRVVVSQTGTGDSTGSQFDNMDAALVVQVQPLINQLGIINLDINIELSNFTQTSATAGATDPAAGNKETRKINSNTNLADGEVLALGGLIRRSESNGKTKIPLIGDIPLIGHLFSNQTKSDQDEMLMIFLSPKIIRYEKDDAKEYTDIKGDYIKDVLRDAKDLTRDMRDPIYRWFFAPADRESEAVLPRFLPDKPVTRTLPVDPITSAVRI